MKSQARLQISRFFNCIREFFPLVVSKKNRVHTYRIVFEGIFARPHVFVSVYTDWPWTNLKFSRTNHSQRIQPSVLALRRQERFVRRPISARWPDSEQMYVLRMEFLGPNRSLHSKRFRAVYEQRTRNESKRPSEKWRKKKIGEEMGRKWDLPSSFPSRLFHFLALVSFLARPKPKSLFAPKPNRNACYAG